MTKALILRDYQLTAVNDVRDSYIKGKKAPLLVAPTGSGKCLAKGTPLLMYDGTIKKVEDLFINDLLMGPDSKPRRVTSLCRGSEEMYKITPVKGDPYVVNKSHILSLRRTNIRTVPRGKYDAGGGIVNISVADYVKKSKTFKHEYKGYRAAVNFPKTKTLFIDPYFLGLWLGDGTIRSTGITTGDPEVKEYLRKYAEILRLQIRVEPNSDNSEVYHLIGKRRRPNILYNYLRDVEVTEDKNIPLAYKQGRIWERLELLAGLLDSDGHYDSNGCYDYISKSERLLDDVIFVARSLGFSAYKAPCKKSDQYGKEGDYFRCSISGDLDKIPCKIARKKAKPRRQKKNVLNVGIAVESIGIGDYYGFEITGDHLFLLGDFTVTHNTVIFSHIAINTAARKKRVLILVHRIELLRQTSAKLLESNVHHGLINANFTPDPMASVQIASVQTLVRRLDKVRLDYDLVIIDEAHHAVAGTWKKILNRTDKARILGVTATPIRADGTGLNDIFDALILGPSIKQLTQRGHLVPCAVYASTEKLDLSRVKITNGDYDQRQVEEIVDNSIITGDAVEYYGKICPGVPCVVFCVSIAHAEHVAAEFRNAGYRSYSVDGTMDDVDRRRLINGLSNGSVQVLTSCDLISEGTDVPAIVCGILLRPTQSMGLFLQQVGRTLRLYPGKTKAFILDHVGNVLAHGMPDEDREWSLEGEVKRKKKKNGLEEKKISVRQCPACFAMHAPAPSCPMCGEVYIVEDITPAKTEGELREISAQDVAALKFLRNKEVWNAKTYEDFVKIGKERGYKPGWAKHKFEAKTKNQPPPVTVADMPIR